MDCIKTIKAVQITYNCLELRYIRSQEISQYLICQSNPSKSVMRLNKSLNVNVSSESWLTHFCLANYINLKNPITLEAVRCKYCIVGYIQSLKQL